MASLNEEELFYGVERLEDHHDEVSDDKVISIPETELERIIALLGESYECLQQGATTQGSRLLMQSWMTLERTKENGKQEK